MASKRRQDLAQIKQLCGRSVRKAATVAVCVCVDNETRETHILHVYKAVISCISHFCTKYEYILYWKLSSSNTEFLNKRQRKEEDQRLTKVLEPVGDKDSVSHVNWSTILNGTFAYSSKTFAMKKHLFSFWPWDSSHDFKRQIRAFYSDKSPSCCPFCPFVVA